MTGATPGAARRRAARAALAPVAPVAWVVLTVAVLTGAAPHPRGAGDLPRSALAVRHRGAWHEWWRSDSAPARWTAPDPVVAGAVRWRVARSGLEWGELRLAGSGEAWRVRVIVARIDPARQRLALHVASAGDGRAGPWSINSAPPRASLAVNAGQFAAGGGPWGWVVRDGDELRPPGTGPLAPAVVVDSSGRVRLVPPDSIGAVREAGAAVEAFQSYPAVLAGDGDVPPQLADTGRGVDLAHRDARLGLGVLRDGRVLIALTRFEGLGGALSALPFGLTTAEMAAVMGALGCERAVLLDGGISGQLMLRERSGARHAWPGLRKVALGLIATPR